MQSLILYEEKNNPKHYTEKELCETDASGEDTEWQKGEFFAVLNFFRIQSLAETLTLCTWGKNCVKQVHLLGRCFH